jgi:hypothetical protein
MYTMAWRAIRWVDEVGGDCTVYRDHPIQEVLRR